MSKFTVLKSDLVNGLKKVGYFVDSKAVNHSSNVQFVVTENAVKINNCNFTTDTFTVVTLENVTPNQNGSFTVQFKQLNDFIKKVKNDYVTFEKVDSNSVKIDAGKVKYTITCNDEYPTYANFNYKNITIQVNDYKKALICTVDKVATTESRPVLQGVKFEFNNVNYNTVEIVATDSHRLGRYNLKFVKSVGEEINDMKVVLSGKVLEKTLKLIDKTITEIVIGLSNDRYTYLKIGNVEMYLKNIEGNYPDTSRLIPDLYNVSTKVNINKNEMLESLALLDTVTDNRNNAILMELNGKVELKSNSPELGNMEYTLDSVKEGDDLKISYNIKYAKNAIETMDGENLTFHMFGSMKPFIITSENDSNAMQLILPVRTI